METIIEKQFDTVKYFRLIKEKLAEKTVGMTLEQQREYLNLVKEGKIKLDN